MKRFRGHKGFFFLSKLQVAELIKRLGVSQDEAKRLWRGVEDFKKRSDNREFLPGCSKLSEAINFYLNETKVRPPCQSFKNRNWGGSGCFESLVIRDQEFESRPGDSWSRMTRSVPRKREL